MLGPSLINPAGLFVWAPLSAERLDRSDLAYSILKEAMHATMIARGLLHQLRNGGGRY